MLLSRYAVALSIFLGLPVAVFAQASYEAQVRGAVTDPTGAVVPGATVTLTDTSTGIAVVRKTDSRGLYTLNGLRPGGYNLFVESNGFRRFESRNITLAVSQQAVINVTLELGALASSVEVTESAPLL